MYLIILPLKKKKAYERFLDNKRKFSVKGN